jgi:hypothetical protein
MITSREEKLIKFIQRWHSRHYECEDNFYGCPKSEGYFGPDRPDICICGKDEADKLLKEIKQ